MKGNNHPMKKIWPFSFYFLLFAGAAAHLPYRVLYYQSLSFTGVQIGLLAGIAPLITVVCYLKGWEQRECILFSAYL